MPKNYGFKHVVTRNKQYSSMKRHNSFQGADNKTRERVKCHACVRNCPPSFRKKNSWTTTKINFHQKRVSDVTHRHKVAYWCDVGGITGRCVALKRNLSILWLLLLCHYRRYRVQDERNVFWLMGAPKRVKFFIILTAWWLSCGNRRWADSHWHLKWYEYLLIRV